MVVGETGSEDNEQDDAYTEDALGTDEGTKDGDEAYTENASGQNKAKSAPRKVKGAQVAADGTYPAYFSVAKYEDGKYKKNYTGILYVVVSDGKISALDYSGDKEKKIKKTLRNSGYIGQTASVSVIQGVDATSSASLNVNGSTSASSHGDSYVMDLKGTIVTALTSAEARDGSSSGETATAVADGVYKGTASNSQVTSGDEANDKVTVNVTVSNGKITSV